MGDLDVAMSAEEEIRHTIALYCQLCDDGRFDEWAELFTDDARFHVMGRTHEGRPAVKAFIEGSQPPERRGKHVTINPVILVDDEAHARAWTDFVFVARSGSAFAISNAGRYHDELVRSGNRWRFSLREIVFLGDPPQVAQPTQG